MAEINGRVGWRNYLAPSTSTNPLWDNLLAYYTADSTANDAKGTANGTLVNGATYTTGKINNGFSFDGINDYANFGNNIDLTGLAPFSFNFWVNPTATTANSVFFSKYDGTKGYLIRKSANGNYVNIALVSSGSSYISVSSNSIVIPSNSYSMITVTYNGTPNISGFKIYVNATSDTLTALYQAFTTSASNTSNFLMGSLATNANFYNGVIDEVAVWNRVITATEVTELYNAGAGKQYVAPTPTYTTRTTAFATATGITDTTILNALNTFDTGLISNGLATKMKALYPFVGGTANTHKYNFMDARDTNAAFRLTFSGGWVHSSNGVLANGTNGYADTYYNLQSLNQNNTHLSIYNTNNYTPTESIDMGAFNEISVNGVLIATEIVPGLSRARIFKNALDYTLTDNRGYFLANSNSTNSQYYINNVNRSTIANSGTFPLDSRNIYIGALNGTNGYYFANGKYTFSSIGDGLTPSEATTFYNLVQAFQTALSRQV